MTTEILKIAFLTLFNALYGYFESNLFSRGFHPGSNDIFHLISSRYHLPMLVFLSTPAILLGYFYLIPALLIIEDQFYFLFEVRDELDEEDWIAKILGSWKILNTIIPKVYGALIILSILMFWAKRLISV